MTIDLSTIQIEEIILWAIVFVIIVFVLRIIWPILVAGFGLLLAGIVTLFALDKLQGGTAINQLMDKIRIWLRSRHGG